MASCVIVLATSETSSNATCYARYSRLPKLGSLGRPVSAGTFS